MNAAKMQFEIAQEGGSAAQPQPQEIQPQILQITQIKTFPSVKSVKSVVKVFLTIWRLALSCKLSVTHYPSASYALFCSNPTFPQLRPIKVDKGSPITSLFSLSEFRRQEGTAPCY